MATFDTVEQIEEHYADAINNPTNSPAAVLKLQEEKQGAIGELRERDLLKRERAVWMREAFEKFPLARAFPRVIEGDTEEQVAASAQSVHERLEAVFTEHQTAKTMREVYERFLQQHQNPNGETNEPRI